MPGHSLSKQIDTTVKLLVILLTEPRMSAAAIAKTLGVSQNYVARMIGRFRDGGLEIDYDFAERKYVGKFSEQLKKSIVGPLAKKLQREIAHADFSQKPVKFVTALNRYTVPEFAELIGVSKQNVYNGIAGYKGQQLLAGWVAYQVGERAQWMIAKADTDRSGKKFSVPPAIANIARVVKMGEGTPLIGKGTVGKCAAIGCEEPIQARGMCSTHYQQIRRNPSALRILTQGVDSNGLGHFSDSS